MRTHTPLEPWPCDPLSRIFRASRSDSRGHGVSEGLQRHQPGPFPGAGSSSVESSWLAKLKAILRRPLDPFVPSHYRDLPALARRLFRSREPGALYAMRLAAFGTMLTPLDLLLQLSERQLYA